MAVLAIAQLTMLKADIAANNGAGGDFENIPDTPDGHIVISDLYNLNSSPDYWVYRGVVSLEEVSEVIELDDVASITATDSDRLIKFYQLRPGGVFANKATDRAGFNDVFSAAAGNDSQQALIALWKRLATRGERLFAAGVGVGTNGDPDTMIVEGDISANYIELAKALP